MSYKQYFYGSTMKKWIWQLSDWPQFTYQSPVLEALEKEFLQGAGFLLGAYQHVSQSDQEQLKIDVVSEEAIETSAIEGEFLDRASVQASLRRNFGLANDPFKPKPSEQGIADMMVDIYNNYAQPLTHEVLHQWHLQLMNTRIDLNAVGSYRQHDDPMQIVSGLGYNLKVHYEAPPSNIVQREMEQFVQWFNKSTHLPALTRAAIAHVYFEMIHPYEDGNGRIGRAIAEKSISQSLQQPTLLAISRTIQKNKKQYYAALAEVNRDLNISNWILFFANTLLEAQKYTKDYIEFLVNKTKLYDRVKDTLNDRQSKVLARIFKSGLDGFTGGLSAENYISITQTSRATATRDLQDLVAKGVLQRVGERKSARYYLNSSCKIAK